MKLEVLIVGGARTPMTDYVGALKDVSTLELGAIAARGAFEKTGVLGAWSLVQGPGHGPRTKDGPSTKCQEPRTKTSCRFEPSAY